MAPVIWGLPLDEIKWSKFKSSYMWNSEYYLRRTKFIVYQCALIFCVVSESLGTAVLSDYTDGQRRVQGVTNNKVYVSNNDYVGAASYNIFAGVFVAFVFGAAFFFDLFWPERYENTPVRTAWKVCGVLAVIFHLAAALTITIITATRTSFIVNRATGQRQDNLWSNYSKYSEAPLLYKNNGRAVAAVVFAWLGWCSVFPSCVLLLMSINHTESGLGPKSKHARERDEAAGKGMENIDIEKASADSEKPSDFDKSDVVSSEPPVLPQPDMPNPSMTQRTHADEPIETSTAAENIR